LRTLVALFSLLFLTQVGYAQPEELGRVDWLRDFAEAQQQSAQEGKPIFILFQEVPGCATCQRYGVQVLSHPLIVEAIETYFVPLAIYNNKGGKDREVLQRFNEPTWNNPVVRITTEKGADIHERLSGDYSPLFVTLALVDVLERRNVVVPNYLRLLREELLSRAGGTEETTFAMYCFWTGEKTYGQVDGVVHTEPGWMHGKEVVKVEYDPRRISYTELLEVGRAAACADAAYTGDQAERNVASQALGRGKVAEPGPYRQDRADKYYLSRTAYRYVPMTDLQATRINARLGHRQNPDDLLSPRQLRLLWAAKAGIIQQ